MTIKLKKNIGQRLKQLRKHLKLSQNGMAVKLYIKKSTYYSYESGENTISIETLSTLSNDLKVSLDWLIANKGKMFVEEGLPPEDKKELQYFTNEVKELLYVMRHLPLVRYEVMGFYQKYKLENQEYITPLLKKIPGTED